MKATAKIRRRLVLPVAKVRKAKAILSAKTDTEAIERALDLIIADAKIGKMLLSVKGRAKIEDVYGRLAVKRSSVLPSISPRKMGKSAT